jgi:hypothetical protein
MAWEVTDDDIELVLQRHGKDDPDTFDKASQLLDGEDGRIEKAALAYTDFDDQTSSALDEIENILIENKILTGPKHFSAP